MAMAWGLRIPSPLPIGRAERHHRRAAGLCQPASDDRVVGGVGQHDEALVDQRLGRSEQLDGVGQQALVVADDLELDPVGLEGLASQRGRGDRLGGGEAARRVGQDLDAQLVEQLEQPSLRVRRSTRRTATVAMAVPEATRARRSWLIELMPPVPMISLEPSRRPAILRPSSIEQSLGRRTAPRWPRR